MNNCNNSIAILLTQDLLIIDINESGMKDFFEKEKQDLVNRSFIDLLVARQIQVNELLKALKPDPDIIFHSILLEDNTSQKKYSATITTIHHKNKVQYAITMNEVYNPSYTLSAVANTIMDYVPGSVYWKDRDGRYMGSNKFFTTVLGLTKQEELIGKTDFDFCWREFADDLRHLDKMVMREDATIEREEKAKLADGKIITALTFKTPLKNQQGDIIGIIGTSLDITERKEMEKALRESQIAANAASQAKTQFIANMNHDIRTPLTGLIVISEVMESVLNHPKEKEYARLINDSGKQLLNLLDGILDGISSDNFNDRDLKLESFDLQTFIQDIVQLELPAIKAKNLDLKINLSGNIPKQIICDKTKLHRILLNLLGNAIKFTQKGHVGIEIESLDQARLRFSIIDTGTGIPDELQSRIFDRHFKVNAPENTQKGHGIGLNLVQSYVNLLGGEIKLISKINQGSRFYFDLLLQAEC